MGRIRGDLLERSFSFAMLMLDIVEELPNRTIGWEIGRQLTRCGAGVGANIHEADALHRILITNVGKTRQRLT